MNPIILITILAVGASAQYDQSHINVRVEEPPRVSSSYSPPQPQAQQVYSAPQQQQHQYDYNSQPIRQQVPIIRFDQDIHGSQANNVQFETGNGIQSAMNTRVVPGNGEYIDEQGRTVQTNSVLEQNGHSNHAAPEGKHISLTWTADKNGFHPTGDHLPRPVEMPAEHAEAHRQALAATAAAPASSSSYSSGGSYNSYSAPQQEQPIRVQSYNAPQQEQHIRVQSYNAPQQEQPIRVQSYDAPQQEQHIRVQSYNAPQQPAIRVQSYSAPAPSRSGGY